MQIETLQMLRVHCIPMLLFLPSPFWARLLNSGLLQNPSILFFSKPCLLFILLSWLIFSISLLLLTPFSNFKLLKWNKILSGHSRTFLLYIHFFSLSISLLLDQYCPIRCSSVMKMFYQFSSVQFSSVAQSCLTLCDPMDCSTVGLPVYQQLSDRRMKTVSRKQCLSFKQMSNKHLWINHQQCLQHKTVRDIKHLLLGDCRS